MMKINLTKYFNITTLERQGKGKFCEGDGVGGWKED